MPRFRTLFVGLGLIVLASVVASTDSRTASVMLQFGDLLFSEGRYTEAGRAYEAARETDDASLRQEASKGLIRVSLRVGSFNQAMTTATELREEVPGDVAILALYGDALWASGLFTDAEEVFAEAMELDAALPEGHHGLARALAAKY